MSPSTEVPSGFQARHERLRSVLKAMRDPQERLSWVVERSRARPPMAPELRTEERLVPGCAARLWLVAETIDGKGRFGCDSDSAILKAAAGLLCELYEGLPLEEVLAGEPAFLEECGLMAQFTENRRRTIRKVREAIRGFASASLRG